MRLIKNPIIEDNCLDDIRSLLYLISCMAMSFEVKETKEFWKGKEFMLAEANENLWVSYDLIKLGYYKQAFGSLRFAYDCGLYSIYFSDYGKDFNRYLNSKSNSPKINKDFWNRVKHMNEHLKEYDTNYKPLSELYDTKELSNYIHSNGVFYSYYGNMFFKRKHGELVGYQETYNLWYEEFLGVVRAICVLHLLRFPILAHVFSDSFLTSKFGISDYYPFFGGLFGDYSVLFLKVIPEDELMYIRKLASKDQHCIELVNYLNSLPVLPDSVIEIRTKRLESDFLNPKRGSLIEVVMYKWPESLYKLSVYLESFPKTTLEEIEKYASEIARLHAQVLREEKPNLPLAS